MRLKKEVIEKVRNNQRLRLEVALILNKNETWVRQLLTKNKENGPLTTYAVLMKLRSELKMNMNEMLETVFQ